MEHQTTVAIHIPLDDGQDKSYVLAILAKINDYVSSQGKTYDFQIINEGKLFQIAELPKELSSFSKFVDTHFSMNNDDELIATELGGYGAEDGSLIDLESGDIEFERSFNIEHFEEYVAKIVLFLNIPGFYSSEIEQLTNIGLGIFCDMNDIDGDYYEFEI